MSPQQLQQLRQQAHQAAAQATDIHLKTELIKFRDQCAVLLGLYCHGPFPPLFSYEIPTPLGESPVRPKFGDR
jgi:hypothetical protein